MANLGLSALGARLAEAAARIRGVKRLDDILDVAAEEGRRIAGARNAWAARIENGMVTSLRTATDDGSAASPPSPERILALSLAARPTARADGGIAAALLGSADTPEGVLVVARAPGVDGDDEPSLDLALAQLATIAGFALEGARMRARIESVTHARETLLACVAHDLRNPLNTFAMSAGLLRDDAERNDIDATRAISLISRMERATSRMQLLIDDLIEASRVDARKIDFALRAESAADIVRAAAAAAKTGSPGEKCPQVVFDGLDEAARVMADRARTLQLLSKVIAFEARSAGDSGTIRLGVELDDDVVVFTARALGPSGAPIPALAEGRGGLALFLASGLAEAQRGAFRIDAGDALAVTVTLPAAKA